MFTQLQIQCARVSLSSKHLHIYTHTQASAEIMKKSVRIDQDGFKYPANLPLQTNTEMPEKCSYKNMMKFELVKQTGITSNNKPDKSEVNSLWVARPHLKLLSK